MPDDQVLRHPYGVFIGPDGTREERGPNPIQMLIHESPKTTKVAVGAWRAGKTYAFCKEALRLSMDFPGNRGLIARKTYRKLWDSTFTTFQQAAPQYMDIGGKTRELYLWDKGQEKVVFPFSDGRTSEILFRNLEDPENVTNTEFGWIFVDQFEEIPIETLVTLEGHLSLPGVPHFFFLAGNPPMSARHPAIEYIHRMNKDTTLLLEDIPTSVNTPNLSADFIRRLEELPAIYKDRYYYGHYGVVTDGTPVFAREFSKTLHIHPATYRPDHPVYRSWDFGYHHPVCKFYQFDAEGRLVLHKEIVREDMELPAFADAVLGLSRTWFAGGYFLDTGDVAGNQRDQYGRTAFMELKGRGIRCYARKYQIPDTLMVIRQKLTSLIRERPAFYMSPDCPISIDAYAGGYRYPKHEEGTPERDVPLKDGFYDNVMDPDRYMLMRLFSTKSTRPRVYIPSPADRLTRVA